MRLAVVVALVPSLAAANPRSLPFTYTTDTLAPGAVELEQYADLEPLRAISPETTQRVSYLAAAFQTEIEIGLCDRLELGLYFTYVPEPSAAAYANAAKFPGVGSGLKQRLRYIFATPGAWPVDVGVYGELTESGTEIEVEGKLLLQRRFDRVRVAANLSMEYELYFDRQRDIVLNPSLGATYEVTPSFHLGVDSWLRGEYPTNPSPPMRTFGLGPAVYAGPAVMASFGRLWWALGTYVRVTDAGHDLQPGEPYGRVFVRSMIGYNL